MDEVYVELLQWLMGQRLSLQKNDPDFFVKHDTLKTVSVKVREMRDHAALREKE